MKHFFVLLICWHFFKCIIFIINQPFNKQKRNSGRCYLLGWFDWKDGGCCRRGGWGGWWRNNAPNTAAPHFRPFCTAVESIGLITEYRRPAGGGDAPTPFKRFLCSCRTCREAHNNIILADCLVAQWQNSFKKFSFVEFCIHKNIFLRTTRCVLFPHRTTNVDNKYSALTWWWKRRARLNKSVCTCIWLKRLWGLGQLSPGRLWPQQGSSVKVRSVAFCPTGPKYPIIGKGREHRLSGPGL